MIMQQKNNISVFDTPVELTVAAAALIVTLAQEAIKARGRFVISLSGGNTPKQLYQLLSRPPFSKQMDWEKTFVFWGDERYVPPADEQNNAHMARVALLDHVPIPPENIYPIPVEPEPAAAARAYEDTIRSFFRTASPVFDLMLLGIGENAHTASLFPHTQVLAEREHLVKEVYIEELQMFRITMTVSLINCAHTILFLVTGKAKAEALKKILTAPFQPNIYPAQLIKAEQGRLYWYVDSDAAALL